MIAENSVGQAYLAASRHCLLACVQTIKHCLGQLSDDRVLWRPHLSMNNANIVLHVFGNFRR